MICLRVSPQTPPGVSLKNVELVLFLRKILYQALLDRAHEGKVTCDLYTLDGRACFSNSRFQHRPPLIHPPSWKQDFPVIFLPFPFPSPPAPAARVTHRRLGTSQGASGDRALIRQQVYLHHHHHFKTELVWVYNSIRQLRVLTICQNWLARPALF